MVAGSVSGQSITGICNCGDIITLSASSSSSLIIANSSLLSTSCQLKASIKIKIINNSMGSITSR